jgi:glycosyltransferase involved in cell wall biosynthesis
VKKIVITTDVWSKNTNGVVTSILYKKKGLEKQGFKVFIIHPGLFRNLPLPTYAEIRLAIFTKNKMEKMLRQINPDYIHIETEGPVGLATRMACLKHNWKFTSSHHTRLPEYVAVRLRSKLAGRLTWEYLRWFHNKSQKLIVSAHSLEQELKKRKFKNIAVIPFGVDLALFKKNPKAKVPASLEKPIFTFLGRVAPEKNLEAFLDCRLPGSKLIIGDGPQRKSLQEKYGAKVVFVGRKKGQKIVDLLSVSDVFVFPSRTDTFGLVVVEALACELPVAAYRVHGPKDIITNSKDGYLGPKLQESALKCLKLDRNNCRKTALRYSWDNFTTKFIQNLAQL